MKSDTIRAKEIMETHNFTCVLCKDDIMYTSSERGVKPLLNFIENNINCAGLCAADKIVGKAAAMLYVLLGVDEVYADVMSEAGIKMLNEHNIKPYYNTSVKSIRNRKNTGICPMEETVQFLSIPEEGLKAIKNKLAQLVQ